ncbi:unnamed protein product [Paramecium pentaurelia]|uniref:Inositol hexakisphosphate and diphosphoinositol-pentakisphosphate kinase n=1 Tax=Paramecium pentaurelia TaxID=43138 RepID=A0A8S1UMK0_9CILI|nr:unnamed protein product [Paramecium pentaurelia]
MDQDQDIKRKIRSHSVEREKTESQSQFTDEIEDDKIVTIGVCCMAKKSQSKEMQEILNRINPEFFQIEIFSEQMILEDPIESWPIVETLISFYSDGFPLNKAIAYADLRKPFIINDLKKQQLLWDRERVYTLLKKNKVPVPKHYFVFKNPNKYIIDDYNRKEIEKKYKSRKTEQEIIEEEDNVDSVINFLQNDDSSQHMKSVQTAKQLQELLLPPRQDTIEDKNKNKMKQGMRSYDARSLSAVIDIKKDNKDLQITKIEEGDDYLLINDQKLVKPFVEKPFDAEDHNIYIYYNSRDGGGCKKLFRKVGNQSSIFDPTQNSIRNDNENYIYEVFLPTNGFDIKVYTVGEFYAHAEARKSPVLDGKVVRSQNGKEMRYPVCLTMEEKMMAIKIVNIFGQNICGFDLLRSNNKSYVCDVNGWSFVKGNAKYYQDCAAILQNMILAKLRPTLFQKQISDINLVKGFYKNSFRPSSKDLDGKEKNSELRSVVAVFRHGDRTPKQKMKMRSTNEQFLSFFDDVPDPSKEIKLKHPKQLLKLLNLTRECIAKTSCCDDNIIKLLQMKSVLELGGHFEGINRKVQIKPLKTQKIEKNGSIVDFPVEVLLILKWGGELTQLGEEHAVRLGQVFRHDMYPTEKDGLLRLHSTYRHDLKTFSSDEGRCQYTAAAFLKGLLGYEGEVTPILATMVQKNEVAQELLDCNNLEIEEEVEIKNILQKMLTSDEDMLVQIYKYFPDFNMTQTQHDLISKFKCPKSMLIQLHTYINQLTKNIRCHIHLDKNYYITPSDMEQGAQTMFESENLTLFFKRWYKLEYDFLQKEKFNISKIPDIYDSVKYDMLHNQDKLQFYENSKEFYCLAELLSHFMVPFEYGITTKQKLSIAKRVVGPLCDKIKQDLLWWNKAESKNQQQEEDYWKFRQSDESDLNSPWRHVRTRLYFTSASHLYSLFNILYYGLGHYLIEDEFKQKQLQQILMLQYLSNIVIKLYEDLSSEKEDPNRFRIELSVSDGIQMQFPIDKNMLPKSDNIHINQSLRLDQLEEFLNQIIDCAFGDVVQSL